MQGSGAKKMKISVILILDDLVKSLLSPPLVGGDEGEGENNVH
jgi:hypothetical protein